MNKLIITALLLGSFSIQATTYYDINNEPHMKELGAISACSLYYKEKGFDRKHAVLEIGVNEEYESDWNKMRNPTMLSMQGKVLLDLMRKDEDSKYYFACDKIYEFVKSRL